MNLDEIKALMASFATSTRTHSDSCTRSGAM